MILASDVLCFYLIVNVYLHSIKWHDYRWRLCFITLLSSLIASDLITYCYFVNRNFYIYTLNSFRQRSILTRHTLFSFTMEYTFPINNYRLVVLNYEHPKSLYRKSFCQQSHCHWSMVFLTAFPRCCSFLYSVLHSCKDK